MAISTGEIVAANKEVQRITDSVDNGNLLKRGPYDQFDDEEREQIGKSTLLITEYLHKALKNTVSEMEDDRKVVCACREIRIREIY